MGRSVEQDFDEKYPLGTAHFLMWLYGQEEPVGEDSKLLVWLADSSYINGQGHRFRSNVGNWLRSIMPLPSFLPTFDQIDTREFDERMSRFQQKMESEGFRQGSGQVKSKYLHTSPLAG